MSLCFINIAISVSLPCSLFFFFLLYSYPRDLHSFPTRRSSDLFVSVTGKLMDELAQCYNVLPQLDINNTIDHRDRKSGSAGMPRPISYAVFCLKKKMNSIGHR